MNKTTDIISKLYHFDEKEFKKLLKKTFKDESWLKVFLDDSHHGFTHGNQVRLACLKLIEKLNIGEKEKLVQEGKRISKINSHQYAVIAIEIAAIFHDCGRFNENGKVIAEEQRYHHILSAKRAKMFCERIGLYIIVDQVEGAILSHDYQNKKVTPNLNAPKTIIDKIVQSADQMGWFHPNSIYRTLDFNRVMGSPFYDPTIALKERLRWVPTTRSGDAVTVMVSQLFGPMDARRFGIEFARQKVKIYKVGLENNILKIAQAYNFEKEVKALIKDFKKHFISR